ncbi:MAG: S8 family serine peptidase [Pseudobacter sp.]|uniref:S8 family serine peptidase n=1 Tax=Pseudobacter sp. TaxID=2045420 RepID=UPI003F7D205D
MRKLFLLLLTLSGWYVKLPAQESSQPPGSRLSPAAVKKTAENQPTAWWLICKDTALLRKSLIKTGSPPILRQDPRTGLTVLRATGPQVQALLAEKELVSYADKPRLPREELATVTFDASANQLNTVHHWFPGIQGQNKILSLKERRPDSSDIDFRGRFRSTSLADPEQSVHASFMATMALGAGNSHFTGRGAAPAAILSSASFITLLPETDADYLRYNISVQNHSYGTGIENYYGADALAYDASVIARPELVHVFSAGNDGVAAATSGVYAGIPAFANLTGSFKMAKNIITVGATDSFYNVAALSSRGPAYDGRLKPELVAYGQDGSSGAAAIVSGIALLLQEAWEVSGNPSLPPAALVKAILINSADETGAEGPDYAAGYGNANAANAVLTMFNKRYFSGSLQQQETQTYTLDIGPGIRRIKITMSYTDPPAAPAASKALVNDLDLSVQCAGIITYPWILSHAAHTDSLKKPARQGIDTLNTTEQITIQNPAPGICSIRVNGSSINTASQSFSIAYQLDTADRFYWYAPTGSDQLRGGVPYMIRWASTFDAGTGRIEYALSDNNWHPVAEVDLSKKCYRWQVPDVNALIRLRITVNTEIIYSASFIVSSRLTAFTGFNCPDSFLIGWNKPAGIQQWRVYTLGEDAPYLETYSTLADTNLVLQKQQQPQRFFAVAPVIDGVPGQKSFTFDYTQQGVDCYIRSFLADPEGPKAARVTADLGSLHGIQRIMLEKARPGGYDTMQSISLPTDLQYNWTDNQLVRGSNTYRLKLELQNGRSVYSQPASVFTSLDAPYLLYPNPVAGSGRIKIYASDFSPAFIQVYSVQGLLVRQQPLNQYPQEVSVTGLQSGLYFLLVIRNGKRLYKTSFLVK